ncbi:capsular polysaccharide biosynthesis protein [Sphingomonas trueperi]|uniref:glycosyltransferase family 61 protein n=1 Tax=Sphingomonas trueperi TaxID=53317 RepID=UPI0033967AF5
MIDFEDPTYVSCAAQALYGDRLPPELLTAEDPRAYGVEVVGQLFAKTQYRWQFPSDGFVIADDFTAQLATFYESMAEKPCPPSVLVRLRDVTLFKTVLHCASTAEHALLYETYRPGDRASDAMPSMAQWRDADTTHFAGRRWQNLFIGSIGTPNYGHWLIDDLPRLKAALQLRLTDRRPIRILLSQFHSRIDNIRVEAIRMLLGDEVRIEFLDFNRAYRFDELYYATPVSEHPVQKSPLAMAFMSRKVCEGALVDVENDGGGARLFVNRAVNRGRVLSNQSEVTELVTSHGFQIVDTERLSFGEQVRLFAGASTVIGQMGAAMTNTVFCPPASTIVYLAPWGWIEPFYWDLAAVRGHRYKVLYGAVADHSVPAHERAFTIDVDALARALVGL